MPPLPKLNRPAVSVVLPVLDPDPAYFRQAVASILGQSMGDLELIVVEDPSPRSAGEVLAEFDDRRVRHVLNPQRTGLVDQLNRGLTEARGELVARMDADDVAEPERLQRQHTLFAERPALTVAGSQLRIIDHRGEHRGYRAYPLSHEDIVAALPRYNPLAHPSVMYRREAITREGGYQYRKYPANEDYELWSRLAVRGHQFANLPEPLLRYRVHPGAMKATRLHGIIRGTLEVKGRYWRDRMSPADRVRSLAERCLLALPPPLVLAIFKRATFRAELPAPRRETGGP
jgi:glycosyltransferase involved in cell wall biosynthesis